eukprot:6185957-Pleurochrysis_carterae.AAC.4
MELARPVAQCALLMEASLLRVRARAAPMEGFINARDVPAVLVEGDISKSPNNFEMLRIVLRLFVSTLGGCSVTKCSGNSYLRRSLAWEVG